MDTTWVPLVEYRRNNIAECVIHGAVSWVSGKNLIYSWGGNVVCYGRSMMKPIMLKVFAEELDPVFNWEQKAISVSSHNGDTEHIRAMKSILNESEMSLMQTPHALPLMQFGIQKRRPRRYYHSCSGEHAAILKGCLLKGWSRVGYTLPHHPLHIAYLEMVRKYLGKDWNPAVIAKDGCGLPTASMSVTQLATMYASLVTEKDNDWIWEAMIKNPDLIGGFNRLDSTIIKSCDGKVIAKEGADGLLGLAILHPDYPEGLGIVIKIAHGWDTQATWYVARYVLGVLGFEFRNPYPLERQKAYIVENVIPESLRKNIEKIQPWDEWDPDRDRWEFEIDTHISYDRA
ncbi:MAG: asparaginase [Candidatus Sericytochromatia bacterium]|nr:asparaginase [Candidatus Sericytochromatia bacterium]